jgi:hypothetical protein
MTHRDFIEKRVKTTRPITKDDMITLCHLLSQHLDYEFMPDVIGGIKYVSKRPETLWYKSVIFDKPEPWCVPDDVTHWHGDSGILFKEKCRIQLIMKFRHGAPAFLKTELMIWEKCFNEIGIVKVGYWPSMKKVKKKAVS